MHAFTSAGHTDAEAPQDASNPLGARSNPLGARSNPARGLTTTLHGVWRQPDAGFDGNPTRGLTAIPRGV